MNCFSPGSWSMIATCTIRSASSFYTLIILRLCLISSITVSVSHPLSYWNPYLLHSPPRRFCWRVSSYPIFYHKVVSFFIPNVLQLWIRRLMTIFWSLIGHSKSAPLRRLSSMFPLDISALFEVVFWGFHQPVFLSRQLL